MARMLQNRPADNEPEANVMASSSGRKSPWVLVALAAVVIIGWLAINIIGGSSTVR